MELSVWWNQSQAANKKKRECENRRCSCLQHAPVLYTASAGPFRGQVSKSAFALHSEVTRVSSLHKRRE